MITDNVQLIFPPVRSQTSTPWRLSLSCRSLELESGQDSFLSLSWSQQVSPDEPLPPSSRCQTPQHHQSSLSAGQTPHWSSSPSPLAPDCPPPPGPCCTAPACPAWTGGGSGTPPSPCSGLWENSDGSVASCWEIENIILFQIVMKWVAHSVATPALLCKKEPAQGTQSFGTKCPLLGAFLAFRWFFMA